MYALLHSAPIPQLLKEQAIPVLLAFLIAELFYKFHSFTLETLAFFVTWYAVEFAWRRVLRFFGSDDKTVTG